jgi:hypothetical protein
MEPQKYRFVKLADRVMGIALPAEEVRTLYTKYLKTDKMPDLVMWCVFLAKHKVDFFVFTNTPKKCIVIE